MQLFNMVDQLFSKKSIDKCFLKLKKFSTTVLQEITVWNLCFVKILGIDEIILPSKGLPLFPCFKFVHIKNKTHILLKIYFPERVT